MRRQDQRQSSSRCAASSTSLSLVGHASICKTPLLERRESCGFPLHSQTRWCPVRVHSAPVLSFVFVCLAGCAPPPLVTKGTFTKSYTLTMQREAMDVVVETAGPA